MRCIVCYDVFARAPIALATVSSLISDSRLFPCIVYFILTICTSDPGGLCYKSNCARIGIDVFTRLTIGVIVRFRVLLEMINGCE